MNSSSESRIAIIGMAGRFPDASDVHEFWRNLENGHESLVSFSDAELLESGVEPELLQNPNYVKRGTVLDGSDLFDAGFFGFNPREAELMDPQHRIFLECAWHAIEDAGYSGDQTLGPVGVYAGASMNTYVFRNVLQNPGVIQAAGGYQIMLGNDKDFLATRVSYKLNLKGPSLTLQTACSTSLVAVQVACQALMAHQCDMALAGGVSLHFPQNAGHLYDEGMIFSSDGRCRPFDAQASGIRAGQGAGIVVLKRLVDAVRDGDSVRAVIRGAAINNDGAEKMGYTAPSVEGQAAAISAALRQSGVDPETVSYVEAHGTGTRVGDPIEIAALERVFRASTQKKQFCALGSVKSNIGHLDTAAGIAGLIKTVLALQHKRIPASLGFETPNPLIDFANSPFYVNTKLAPWPSETPRRAAVSSFGIGGTNAHVVLEEAPSLEEPAVRWPAHVLALSAKTAPALETLVQQMAAFLREQPDASLADVCYTLQVGRKTFPHRRAFVCAAREDAIASLGTGSRENAKELTDPPVTFMFSGQGSQHPGMARGLYQTQPTFRKWFDASSESLRTRLGCDLRDLLYSPSCDSDALHQTHLAQPALFAIEYSLARVWMSWGVQPDSMIGHSIGEYVAACLAGVFSLEDALQLVEARGRIMQRMPAGSMMAVPLAHEQLGALMNGSLSIAAVNAPSLCTVSGPEASIQSLRARLQVSGVDCRPLHTSHAFHSSMMDDALEPFLECVRQVKLNAPRIPFLSNLTGKWIRPEDATNPSYWVNHLRQTVRFADGIRELASVPGRIFLEVGPGQTLCAFAREFTKGVKGCETLASLPRPKDSQSDVPYILNTVAKLWLAGVQIDWTALHEGEKLHRIPLPSYPFERQRYWVKPQLPNPSETTQSIGKNNIDDWFYAPSWTRSVLPTEIVKSENHGPWLIFKDENGLADRVVETLTARGDSFVTVEPGAGFVRHGERAFGVHPELPGDYFRLITELQASGLAPRSILYLWGLPAAVPGRGRAGFHSLLRISQALGDRQNHGPLDWIVVSAGLHNVTGRETVDPEQALLVGPVRVIPSETPLAVCRLIDLPLPFPSHDQLIVIAENLLSEPAMQDPSKLAAYRDGYRWQQSYLPVRLPAQERKKIRQRGVYLITGGTGGIGLTLGAYLAESFQARLALTCRTPLPPRAEWKQWLETHGESDRVAEILRAAGRLESLGAEVLLLNADVSDRAAMHRAVCEIHDRFGQINGVIHAAGISTGGLVQLKTPEIAEKVLSAKVDGTQILDAALAGGPLDFFVLCSSINSIFGSPGLVDYSSANAFLDAFAASKHSQGRRNVTSLNWDAWQEVGMAANTEVPLEMRQSWKATLAMAIKPAEGVEAFRRALDVGLPQVAIVTRDLEGVIKAVQKQNEYRMGTAKDESPETKTKDPSGPLSRPQPLDPRLNDAEPAGDTQQQIMAIWKELLGVEVIGLDDNFFELGGHSLLATRVLSRVRNTFGLAVPLQAVFDAPTIRLLADHVDTLFWATASPSAHDSETREEMEL